MDAHAAYRSLYTPGGRHDPFPLYAAMHAEGPVLDLGAQSKPRAVVHGYDAVTAVLRDPVFRSVDAERLDRTKPVWQEHAALVVFMNSMMFSNGAKHLRSRRLITQVFTARRINALAGQITELVDRLLDRMADKGSAGAPIDFMTEFAYALPSSVIGALLGVPEEDRDWFLPHVIAVGGVLDGRSPERLAAGDRAAEELMGYFNDLIAQRRAHPRDDVTSALIAGWRTDDELTELQLLSTLVLLFNAGFETTTHLLGNGMGVLLGEPGLIEQLRRQPELAPSYVEEFLRIEAPAQLTTRWAAADTEVCGVPVPAGQDVLVMFGAANHDPRRFPQPSLFDPHRPAVSPLTFSAGPHFCPGAALSRLEGEIALSRLISRFPGIASGGPPTRLDQLALRGYTSIPVVIS